MGVISEDKNTQKVEMEFSIAPEDPEIIPKVVDYLESSTAPIIYVNRFIVESQETGNNTNIKKVTFRISLVQPFIGETYEY